MESLVEALSGLSQELFKELDKFIRHQTGGSRKDRELLFLFHEGSFGNTDEDIRKFYQLGKNEPVTPKKRKTFLQWKYILNKQVEDFYFLKSSTEDASQNIFKLFLIGRFLFHSKKYSLAYKYLFKAEEGAEKEQQYELLQMIYSLQIEFAWTNPGIDINRLTNNWKQNSLRAQKKEALNVSLGLIRQELSEIHKAGEVADIDRLTEKILREYGMDEEVKNNVGMMYKLSMIVQTVMEEKKNFSELAEYLVRTLDYMEAKNMFEKHNYRLKIELLTSICRAYIKQENYQSCEHYLKKLEKEHELHPEHMILNVKSMMIKYVLLFSTGRLSEAEAHIKNIENSRIAELAKEDDYFFYTLHANLISSHYFKGDFQTAKKYIAIMINNEKRLKNFGGVELLICAHFIDCMINMELDHYDYVIYKLRALKNRFSAFLKKPENLRYHLFLKLLRELATGYGAIESFDDAEKFLKLEKPPTGHYEFVDFQPYILSKMENRDYYETNLNF